jgi:glycosyltransferase involved in cell wall biosynthesis
MTPLIVIPHPLKITFLLPGPAFNPIGGYKVVYEYANYLCAKGHQVAVLHPATPRIEDGLRTLGLRKFARMVKMYVQARARQTFKPSWFPINPAIQMLWSRTLAERHVPDSDVLIASAWETAEWAASYSERKGKKFYLVQHLETWNPGFEERSLATWKAPLEKIVIAPWLQRHAQNVGQTSKLVYNGLDFDRFRLELNIEDRDPYSVLMIYHLLDWKGTRDGMEAFKLAQQAEPRLRLTLFSIYKRPDDLPADIEFHFQPTQEDLVKLYNSTSIFIAPSWAEGWPLPPAEAMMCGAAVVATTGGADESYAVDERTALVSPVKNPTLLARNILRLVGDDALRIRLATQGHASIQEFTWARAGNELERILLSSFTNA